MRLLFLDLEDVLKKTELLAQILSLLQQTFFSPTQHIGSVSLTANVHTEEVCQSIGYIPDSAAQSLPNPSRLTLSSPVAAINYASWTEALLGRLPAETWQKLVAPPLQTLLI